MHYDQPSTSVKGWALKATKKPLRMGDNVRAYLTEKFDAGAISGLTVDPVQVSCEMKLAKDESGHSLFTPEKWRKAQQITSFRSRLSAIEMQKQTDQGQYEEAIEEIQEEDLEEVEHEIVIDGLRRAVIHDMTVPRHPIEVGKRNVCELSRARNYTH